MCQMAGQALGTEPQDQAQRALEGQVQPLGVHSQAPARRGPRVVALGTSAPWRGRPADRRGASVELRGDDGQENA